MQTDAFAWPNGASCAVSLVYDDGLPAHYQVAAPHLEQNGLRGTFYATITSDPMANPDRWKELAGKAHELGNHTVFHPCRRVPPENFGWLEDCYDLVDYSATRLEAELRVANLVLKLIDGKDERSYGNTCCVTTFGSGANEQSMDPILKKLFVAGRGPFTRQVTRVTKDLNLMQVGHCSADSRTFDSVRTDIEEAVKLGGWATFMIHGVGKGTHTLFMETDEHRKLAEWLGQNRQRIWTAPFVQVARHVKAWLEKNA